MRLIALFLGSMLARTLACIEIGSIANVIFIPNNSNGIAVITNHLCTTCECYAKQRNYLGFNCFSNNNTCALFSVYSVRYSLETFMNATFYFFALPPIGKRERDLKK